MAGCRCCAARASKCPSCARVVAAMSTSCLGKRSWHGGGGGGGTGGSGGSGTTGRRKPPNASELNVLRGELGRECLRTWSVRMCTVPWVNRMRRAQDVLNAINRHEELPGGALDMLEVPQLYEPTMVGGAACVCCGVRADVLAAGDGSSQIFNPAVECKRMRMGRGEAPCCSALKLSDIMRAERQLQRSLANQCDAERQECVAAVPALEAEVSRLLPLERARRESSRREYQAAKIQHKVYTDRKKMWPELIQKMVQGCKTLTLRAIVDPAKHRQRTIGRWHVLQEPYSHRSNKTGELDAIRYTNIRRVTWQDIRTDPGLKRQVIAGEGLDGQFADDDAALQYLVSLLRRCYRPRGGWKSDDRLFHVQDELALEPRDSSVWDIECFEFHRIFRR